MTCREMLAQCCLLKVTQIALQFPDELLHASVPIYQSLKARLGGGRDLYVLADTSYGRYMSVWIRFE
jgi:diphthamide biosynthesis enzyme Dph1/Dph2-like protein